MAYPVPPGYDYIPDDETIAEGQENYPFGYSQGGYAGTYAQSPYYDPQVAVEGLLEGPASDMPQEPPQGIKKAMSANQMAEYVIKQMGLTPQTDDLQLDNMIIAAGGDPDDPAFQQILQTSPMVRQMAMKAFSDSPDAAKYRAALGTVLKSVAVDHPGPYTPTGYEEAMARYGFDTPVPKGSIGIGASALGTTAGGGAVGMQKSPEGGRMYPNGVIFDPMNPLTGGQPAVLFPEGDASVAGSSAWLAKVQRTWGPEQVNAQVQELVKYGYLPKEYRKTKVLSVGIIEKLREFHQNRYAYGNGRPVQSDEFGAPGSAGAADGGIEMNLRSVRAGIAEGVRGQYQRVFGDDPRPAELKEWTEFVIRMGNQMQRGQKGLTAAAASSEALARAGQRMEKAPAAKWDDQIAEEQEENTQLRDGLATAAAATSGIIGWRS